jgi:hypothetical protein
MLESDVVVYWIGFAKIYREQAIVGAHEKPIVVLNQYKPIGHLAHRAKSADMYGAFGEFIDHQF